MCPPSCHGCRVDVRPGRAYTHGHVPACPTAEPVALVTVCFRVTSASAALHSLSWVPLPFLPGLVCCQILEPCGLPARPLWPPRSLERLCKAWPGAEHGGPGGEGRCLPSALPLTTPGLCLATVGQDWHPPTSHLCPFAGFGGAERKGDLPDAHIPRLQGPGNQARGLLLACHPECLKNDFHILADSKKGDQGWAQRRECSLWEEKVASGVWSP